MLKPGAMVLKVRPGTSEEKKDTIMSGWYRQQIKLAAPELIAKWEPIIGVEVSAWGVRRMKTRWGSCSIQARRIWLNLELAKWPVSHLEYVVVHEMVHLLERGHNKRFYGYLDQFLPGWRPIREALKVAPIGLL